MERRRLLGAVVAALGTPLAGCLGDDDAPEAPEYDDWFENVPHFDGFEDRTDSTRVTVLVGAGENGFRFDPPAITVTPDTTVAFEWTGEGGTHNVEARDDSWSNPGGLIESDDHVWEREFGQSGTHLYQCWPHRSNGMKGGIFVDANAGES